MHPRTVVLSIPLMLAFWIAVGLRASFFIPSELPSAWLFRFHEGNATDAHSAVRASLVGWLAPMVVVVTLAVTVPLLGWSAGLRHLAFALAMIVLLAELVSLTVAHMPFTQAYPAGHAKLKTRWPIYAFAAYWFAYGSVARELRVWNRPVAFVALIAGIGTLVAACRVATPYVMRRRSRQPDEPVGDDSSLTVLALSGG